MTHDTGSPIGSETRHRTFLRLKRWGFSQQQALGLATAGYGFTSMPPRPQTGGVGVAGLTLPAKDGHDRGLDRVAAPAPTPPTPVGA